jgi:selenocysteine-specific elongation factor
VRISPEFAVSVSVINALVEKLRASTTSLPDRLIDVPSFKDIAGVSRKYAIPLLEYFDQQKITARRGDKRLIL